jgi:hypothetical protein
VESERKKPAMNLDNLDTLIMEADPALDAPIPSAWSAEAQRLYLQLTAQTQVQVHRRKPVLVATSVLGIVAVTLAILIVIVLPGPSGQQPAAAAVLAQAATNAGRHRSQLGPHQYLYTQTRSLYQLSLYSPSGTPDTLVQGATARVIEDNQVWISQEGVAKVLRSYGALQFPSARDRTEWISNPIGQRLYQTLLSESRSPGQVQSDQSLVDVSDLPTSASQLKSILATGEMQTNIDLLPQEPNAVFERAAALLLGPVDGMTPALAAGLFQVLASQPETRLVPDVAAHDGRRGDGVVLSSLVSGDASEVIVDPNSGSLLEAQFASPPSAVASGGVEGCIDLSKESPNCQEQSPEATLAPIWTDLVSRGAVASVEAKLPAR